MLWWSFKIKPEAFKGIFQKGSCLNKLGKYEEAIRTFDTLLEAFPSHPEILYNRACSKNKAGYNIEDIIADLKEAVGIGGKQFFRLIKEDGAL